MRKLTAPLLGGLLACSLSFAWPVAAQDDEADTLRKLQSVQREITAIRARLQGVQDERAKLNQVLRDTERNIGELHKDIRRINRQLDDNQREITQLEADLKSLQNKEQQQRQLLREHIQAVYAMGRQSRLKLILNEEDPATISRTLVYYDRLREARNDVIDNYRETADQLATLGPKLAASREKLQENRAQFVTQRDALATEQRARQRTVDSLNQDIANKQSALQQLQRDQAQLQEILETLQQLIANMAIPSDFEPFETRKGKLRWPVKGRHLNTFGASRGAEMNWQGITIAADAGTDVSAIHPGRVVFADWLKGYGLLIILDHGNDYLSLYANNQSLLKNLGDWVSAGEAIATVGNSGGRDRSSVYFEIRRAGSAVNPSAWCR
ncbi:MAG TPA: peptidoglycan DD-metalloendopeptidase family protein [Pseudomonadales bacterium]|nr:peptidoglycan DD-metalloendopeptidase family protein [Pseudomonadales bacterium]